jgi:hypothetical protein
MLPVKAEENKKDLSGIEVPASLQPGEGREHHPH